MKGMLDETELARLEELAEKASEGPWNVDNAARSLWVGDGDERCEDVATASALLHVVDLHYIAAACNSVPALIAEIRRLREKVDVLEWFVEVRKFGLSRMYDDISNDAAGELLATTYAAREAVDADPEY